MKRYYYLIGIQFLGFRYHGWQKQPKLKTIHERIDKTLKFILGDVKFKTLGASRTDAMVSALEAGVELFIDETPIENTEDFLKLLNVNLPSDIKAISIAQVNKKFNIIQDVDFKEYRYLFSFPSKNHPFCSAFMANFQSPLDIEIMKEGARLFEGRHYFRSYCARPSEQTDFEREVFLCELIPNTEFTASFFPEKSYILKVSGKGFMRYQVRLMMGALVLLGKGEIDLDFIKNSLKPGSEQLVRYIAPASGLHLHKLSFDFQKSK
ncbi:tRNA pseudouridine(38-40) synthase TruA [Leptobacterium flavescens]|uniref:tRNA pseudouridine synthase A n=1 Tax=Leptobacterium flavescens TaxID=472055 RepID=A0A6P0UPH8_9FLAO|nr:tRNA pseudouridine synthase A [Leptobacterium flavescens]NER13739.1 tRNA pseudouridine(38-40) synthase TruA [Leptobacterium flavescens]